MFILFSFICPFAHANIFDELEDEQRQKILTDLKDQLPKMITVDDGLQKYATYVTNNVPLFAINLGKLSAGEYSPIISQSISLGGDHLAGYFEDTLSDDGLGKISFSYLREKTGSFKKIALSLMDLDKSWGDVEDIIWNETKTVIMEDAQGWAEDAAKGAFNWVLGDPSIVGLGAADLYIMAIKVEMIFINVKTRRFTIEKINNFYEPYLQLRKNGEGHRSAWENSNRGPYSVGADVFFALGDMPEEKIKKLFEQCYQDPTYGHNLYSFMKYMLDRDVAAEKNNLAKTFRKPKSAFRNNVQKFWEQYRSVLKKLIDEAIERDKKLKKRYEKALQEAEVLLIKIKDDDERRQPACDNYLKYKKIRRKALDAAYDIEFAVEKLETLLEQLDQCPEILSEIKETNNDLETLKKLYAEHENFVKIFQQSATKVCTVAHSIKESKDKGEARQALNRTMDLARSAKKKGTEAKTIKEDLTQKIGTLTKRVSSYRKGYFTGRSIEEQLSEAKSIMKSIGKLEESEKDFRDAEKRMKSALMKTSNLTLTINKYYKQLEGFLSPFRGSGKADDIFDSAQEAKENINNCDERINQEAVSKRKKKNRSNSLMGKFMEYVPDFSKTDSADEYNSWPDFDFGSIKTKYERSNRGCNISDKLQDPIEVIKALSSLSTRTGLDMVWDVDIYMDKITLCTADALISFNENFLGNDKNKNGGIVDEHTAIQKAQVLCDKRLPGSSPALDKNGRLETGVLCQCPDGEIDYFNKCTVCSEIKQSFDNNVADGKHDQAKRILANAFQCDWVRERQDIVDLTDREYCPDRNSVRLSDEIGNNQCVHCDTLEKDFDAVVDGGDRDYAESLLGLASTCHWFADGQEKLNQAKPCLPHEVKLSNDNGRNQCVSCDVLQSDFNAAIDSGELGYAETLLSLSSTCGGWTIIGQKKLNQAKPCPANTVKLSDENNKNQCIPCSTLQADFNAALIRGDKGYANTLIGLASLCSWPRAVAQQMNRAEQQANLDRRCRQQLPGSHTVINGDQYNCRCDDGMLLLTSANGNQSCKSCEHVVELVNAALNRNDLKGANGLISGAQSCSWYNEAVQVLIDITRNRKNSQLQPDARVSSQQNNILTGTWDAKTTDLNPIFYGEDKLFDSTGTGTLTITQNGSRVHGLLVLKKASVSFKVKGNVNGNRLRLILYFDDGSEILNLQVNYNKLTLTGISNNKTGEPSMKWFASKRR